MAKAKRKRKVSAPLSPLQGQLAFAHEGEHFDLREIFKSLNAKYFKNSLKRYRIVWGRRMRRRPRWYFVFGSIQEEDRIIRIHPLLDSDFVPKWFVEYVVYHEMLHAVVKDEVYPSGRRKVHTDEFLAKERRFRFYRRARKWEDQNLARFLR